MSAKILLRQPDVGVGGGGGNETFRGQKQTPHSGSEHLVEMRVHVIGFYQHPVLCWALTPGSHLELGGTKEEEAKKQHFTLGWM